MCCRHERNLGTPIIAAIRTNTSHQGNSWLSGWLGWFGRENNCLQELAALVPSPASIRCDRSFRFRWWKLRWFFGILGRQRGKDRTKCCHQGTPLYDWHIQWAPRGVDAARSHQVCFHIRREPKSIQRAQPRRISRVVHGLRRQHTRSRSQHTKHTLVWTNLYWGILERDLPLCFLIKVQSGTGKETHPRPRISHSTNENSMMSNWFQI